MTKNSFVKFLILIVVLYIIKSCFIFINEREGQIINAATGKPISNIDIIRETNLNYFFCISEYNCHFPPLKTEFIKTDNKGKFKFNWFISLKSPFNSYYGENIRINERNDEEYLNRHFLGANLKHNTSYESNIIMFGLPFNTVEVYPGFSQTFDKNLKIKLVPYLSNKSECNNDEQCLFRIENIIKNCRQYYIEEECSILGNTR